MPSWFFIVLVVGVIVFFVVVIGIAMFSAMGTKRKTGTMRGGGRSSNKKHGKKK